MNKRKNIYIEVNRIIFTLYIILMHSEYLFRDIKNDILFRGGYVGVDFFFIVSGFFLAMSINDKQMSTKEYLLSRLKRLYPHYFFSILIMTIIFLIRGDNIQVLSQCFLQHIFMLQSILPVSEQLNAPLWYVTYLILISAVVFWGGEGQNMVKKS